jgi:hypothetical protein
MDRQPGAGGRSVKHPERILLWVAMQEARSRGDWRLAGQLEQKLMVEKFGGRLDAIEARLARLDARRVKQAPGQGSLDLHGGPGTGQPCGESHIAAGYTCHKGGGGAAAEPAAQPAAVLDSSKPFTPEVMERLKSGIEQRTFASNTSRHDGTDLALALEKLATAEGRIGENARSAMAFMDEVKAIVKIAPTRDVLPARGKEMYPPSLDTSKPIDPQMEELNAYLQDGDNHATRKRAYAVRFGFFTPERLEALQADKSPTGEEHAKTLARAMDPSENQARFAKLKHDAAVAAAALNADPENPTLKLRMESAFALVRSGSWGNGPHGDMMAVEQALSDASGLDGTGGHYSPGGNAYHVVSGAGAERGALRLEEVGAGGMSAAIGNSIRTRGIRPVHTLSGSYGLTGSERALATHLHELGHLVHDASARRVVEDDSGTGLEINFARNAMRQITPDPRSILSAKAGPSGYANTNPAELFAESFVGYVVAPDAMREQLPELYRWVDSNLGKARNVARESSAATMWRI